MSPYAMFLALGLLAFVVGAASRTRWVPLMLPGVLVVYWTIPTVQLAADGEHQTGLAVFVGVVVVGSLAAAAEAGKLVRAWRDERPELDSNQRPTP